MTRSLYDCRTYAEKNDSRVAELEALTVQLTDICETLTNRLLSAEKEIAAMQAKQDAIYLRRLSDRDLNDIGPWPDLDDVPAGRDIVGGPVYVPSRVVKIITDPSELSAAVHDGHVEDDDQYDDFDDDPYTW